MDTKSSNIDSSQERYKYLVNSILQKKQVWMLQTAEGMFAMFEDTSGQSYIPVWPEEDLANSFAVDDWEGYKPARMGLREFLEWMNELKNDQILIGAFPNSDMQSLAVDPLDFKKQLSQ